MRPPYLYVADEETGLVSGRRTRPGAPSEIAGGDDVQRGHISVSAKSGQRDTERPVLSNSSVPAWGFAGELISTLCAALGNKRSMSPQTVSSASAPS